VWCLDSTTRCVTAWATGSTTTRVTSPHDPSLQLTLAPISIATVLAMITFLDASVSGAVPRARRLSGDARLIRRSLIRAAMGQRPAGRLGGSEGNWGIASPTSPNGQHFHHNYEPSLPKADATLHVRVEGCMAVLPGSEFAGSLSDGRGVGGAEDGKGRAGRDGWAKCV
jgi:hypothetical protein